MEFLTKYVKKYWKPFSAAIFCLVLEAICDLIQPTIMSKIVDIGVANKQMSYVMHMTFLMLMVTVVGAVAATGRNILSSNVSQKFGTELRSDLFKKIQTFSFDNIDKFERASLITRLTNDVTQVQNFANGLMRIFVKAPILCIGSLFMAIRLNPQMSLILVAVIPIVAVLIFINMRVGYPFFIRVQNALDKVNSVIREYLTGVRVVKAFNRFDYEVKRFEEANDELASVSTNAMRLMSVFSPSIALTVNLGIVAVIWFGGLRVNNGNIHVGQIIAFINYMTQILFSLMMVSFVFTMLVRARASASRIGEVFMLENNVYVKENPVKISNIKGRIDFEHVYFSYPNASGESILKDITLTCMPNDTLGIIGSTGSGKSTLVSLVPHFYNITSGTIKIDGIDINNIDPKNLRDRIAVVPQNAMLFTGTVIDNIRWGKEDATLEEVIRASEVAQAHSFISTLPEEYNTQLGQGGVNFSGGQKQRISIARALIKKPDILILDDCTSAVDVTTEGKIREALKNYSSDITCLIVSQRITSIMWCNKIVVLDNGSIVDIGKHEDLIQNCNVYQEIFRSQVGKEVI
ncbi:ABC transporter ATP-binding protein [Clostridium sp. OS1-26]|uniref:ABC transporter ATP-binding protein n=1 Tax=Clostridium sp. OS1-26 TaxID=3070681 RepID=UPI0027E09B4D|nr:ABC transporter ATP-binding protein [Clostridium sp. OS1-26]WML37180.1 ABC transporter ATP-binding protein [Clostridium sp. OS1-26]